MPKAYRQRDVDQLDEQLGGSQLVDLAVSLRVLNDDATPGEFVRWPSGAVRIFGGRWDRRTRAWVTPQPDDLHVVEWTVQKQQLVLFTETPPSVMFVLLLGGRQAGKSRIGLMDVVADWLATADRDFIVVSLSFKTSRECQEAVDRLLSPTWEIEWSETDKYFRAPHGGRLLFRSAEAIESLRGPRIKTIVLDEGAYMPEEAFTTAVGCGAASTGFKVLIPTTPKRECRWLRKKTEEWHHPTDPKLHAEARVVRLRSHDNPLRNRALLARLEDEMPPDLFAQEFNGEDVAPESAVWYYFSRSLHIRPEGDLPEHLRFGLLRRPDGRVSPDAEPRDVTREFTLAKFRVAAPLILGWDFGREAVVGARIYAEQRRAVDANGRDAIVQHLRAWIVGELVRKRTTTEQHAELVADKFGTDAVVICDAIGQHERSEGRGAGTAAPMKLLREAGFLRVVAVAEKNPDVENSVRNNLRLLKSVMRGYEKLPMDKRPKDTRMFIAPNAAPLLVEALENQERDDRGRIVLDDRAHVIDAWRYLAWRCFPIKSPLPAGFHRAA